MRVIEREIPYRGRGTELRLYPLADIHLGNRATDEARLDRALDEIDGDAGGLRNVCPAKASNNVPDTRLRDVVFSRQGALGCFF